MATAFERLIAHIPDTASVVDVGAGGCEGENSSNYLLERFANYTGVNIKHSPDIDRWVANHPGAKMCFADFFSLSEQWDFVVFDATIELQLATWRNLSSLLRFIRPGGYLAMYIMTNPTYGDENTHRLLAEDRVWRGGWEPENLKKHLLALQGFKLVALEQEERRPEIYWVLLQYA